MSPVRAYTFDAPPVNEREILRYAGMKTRTPEVDALLAECLSLAEGVLVYRVCAAEFDVVHADDGLDLGFAKTPSASLKLNLRGCSRVVLFAATVGTALDRLIARASLTSPAKAQMLNAVGVERVEALCDAFEATVSGKTHPRFSPGYGDVPLSMQRDVFAALSCPKHIGVTLNESLLMSPSKSVTALIGIEDEEGTP